MDAGEYVPDAITNDMVRDRLAEADAVSGWLLDGYPRTIDQARVLDDVSASQGGVLDVAVVLDVETDELVRRLAHRAGAEGRSDDTEEIIRRRQQVYQDQTQPLLEHYAERGLLVRIPGAGHPDAVSASILAGVRAALAEPTAAALTGDPV
jgi:adenylate kinase